MNKEVFDKENVFGLGEPNNSFAKYFIGNSYLNPLTNPKECPIFLANVTFLSQVVEITGIFIMQVLVVDKYLYVLPDMVGTKKKIRKPLV